MVSLIIPRVLGPEQFGQYSLVESLFRYGVAFDLGLSVLVDRQLPMLLATASDHDQMAFSSTVLWLRLYIAALAVGITVLLLPLLLLVGALPFRWMLGVTALTAGMLGMLANGPMSIERARSQRRRFAFRYGGALAVLSFGRLSGVVVGGVAGCFAVMGVSYAALAAYCHRGMLPARARPDAATARGMFREAMPLFLTLYTYTLLVTANRWVVALGTDASTFGHFAFGSSVVTLLVGVVGGMTQLWYPRLARLHASGETNYVSRSVLRDLAVLSIALAAISVAGTLISPWVIAMVYPKFLASLDVIQLILASLPATATVAWLLPLALSTGAKPWQDGVLLYVSGLILLVVLTEAGLRMGGIEGASWGLIVSMPTLVGLQLWRLGSRRVIVLRDAVGLFVVVSLTTAFAALVAVWC